MFALYSILLTIGFILMLPLFLLRKKKYAAGFWQRFGYIPALRQNENPVIWIHCVSVGETNAAVPLVKAIKEEFPDYRIVISTVTKTGQELAQKLFSEQCRSDFLFSVRLEIYRPPRFAENQTECRFDNGNRTLV